VTPRAPRLLAIACALAAPGLACNSSPAGVRVDVNMNGITVDTLQIFVSASPDGFDTPMGSSEAGVTLSTQTDASGKPALVMLFQAPFAFGGGFSFRLDTANSTDLTVGASALGFQDGTLVAAADAAAVSVPAGGAGTLPITLGQSMGQIVPDTRTIDLAGDKPDIAVEGAVAQNPPAALAACDLDGDGTGDLVIGAPNVDDSRNLGGVGAVYIVFGGAASGTVVDLAGPGSNPEQTFYGAGSGDHLGTAVACADLDKDGYGDLVVGAPGADGGNGRLYVLFGRQNLRSKPFDVVAPDAVWTSPDAGGGLGQAVFAGDVDGDGRAEILAAAPVVGKVHLFSKVTAAATPGDAGAADHVTFSGVAAAALGGGDLNADGKPDIALGDPEYRPPNSAAKTGVVYVFGGVDPTASTAYAVGATDPTRAQSSTIVGPDQSQLGAALLVLDTAGSGADLMIGAPGAAGGAGVVYTLENDGDFFATNMPDPTAARVILTGPAADGRFGGALAASRSGASAAGGANLVVGALGTTRGDRSHAGAAYLLRGGHDRLFPVIDQIYGADANDLLGSAVAGGQIGGGDMIGDFAALAPGAPGSGGAAGAGSVYVVFGH